MYKIDWLEDNIYQVVKRDEETNEYGEYINHDVLFQGNLSDCNAWLQLNDKDYFN